MAAKKTAKKTTESPSAEAEISHAPVAKKAAAAAPSPDAKKAAAPAKSSTAPASPGKAATGKPSLDAIARAAYLNYRRRVEQGLPGDSYGDWLEAENQTS